MPKKDKLERVEQVISELNLNACADTKIGNALVRGISGGERKRTSIGVELIKDPAVLFLDEPTTGLDSFTSLSIIETLKALARSNRTIVRAFYISRVVSLLTPVSLRADHHDSSAQQQHLRSL